MDNEISNKENMWIYALPVLLSFRFVLGVFDSGQVNFLMIALVLSGLYCFENEKNILGGALFALSLMFKHTPFIFIPYFFVKQKFKAVFLTIVFMVFYCILPAVYSGWDKEKNYLAHWLPSVSQISLDRGSWIDYKNQSFYLLILRYFMKGSPYQDIIPSLSLWSFQGTLIFSLLLSSLIYILMVFPGTRSVRPNMMEYSLLFIGLALFNPNAWTFNYVSLMFAYMALGHYFLKNGVRSHKLIFMLTVCAFALTSGGSQSLVGRKWQHQLEVLSTVTIGTMIMLFILCSLKYKKDLL